MKFGQAFTVSMGALLGGAAGFYLLEDYKIKAKVKYTMHLLSNGRKEIFSSSNVLSFFFSNYYYVLEYSLGTTFGHAFGKETRI